MAAQKLKVVNPVNGNRINVSIFLTKEEVGRHVAKDISDLVHKKPDAVLGLATGSTPVPVYEELIRLHKAGLDFSGTTTFNLDEYFALGPEHPQSYAFFMKKHLFDHINIQNTHIPNGCESLEVMAEHCDLYENKMVNAGGIDYQILGIGRDGHIGFMEPGSDKDTRTSIIKLDEQTRNDNWEGFFGPAGYLREEVPAYAISMGVATILEAKKVVLLATGKHKADIVMRAIEGPITKDIPASFIQTHQNAEFVLDQDAASELAYLWTYGDEDPRHLFYQGNLVKDMTAKKALHELYTCEPRRVVRKHALALRSEVIRRF